MQRLDKILSEAGAGSRKELKALIRAGRVTANGKTVRNEAEKFDETVVSLAIDGVQVEPYHLVVLLLNKPAGYVTSTDDPRDRTVMELIPERYRKLRVAPVGRLDKETEGLLLLTNDGGLAHRIIHPRSGVWKVYYAEHERQAGPEDCAAFAAGLTLGDGTVCLPAKLEPQGPGKSLVHVQEGKYHQVRRMLASRGMPVSYLRRISEGCLTLGELETGALRELSAAETEALRQETL